MSEAQLEKKVADYLREYRRSQITATAITSEQLQAEMTEWRSTPTPEVLRELLQRWDDPFL